MLLYLLVSCTQSSKIDSASSVEDTHSTTQDSGDTAQSTPSSDPDPSSEPEGSLCTNEILSVTPNDQAEDVL